MELSRDLLDILACPNCTGPLQATAEALICRSCRLSYPIREGIPVLLVEEAEETGEE